MMQNMDKSRNRAEPVESTQGIKNPEVTTQKMKKENGSSGECKYSQVVKVKHNQPKLCLMKKNKYILEFRNCLECLLFVQGTRSPGTS